MDKQTLLLNGDEAVAYAALDAGVNLGAGYPGTPSTEILEKFAELGGEAQWSPNEKVALEVSIGAAFGHARVITTMKHVGLNVAADPLFTATYTGVDGGLVVIVADDPGMASSQNEQDSRRHAIASGAPIIEPCDAQQAYDCLEKAFIISEKWHIPVILRLTTRVSHSKSLVTRRPLAKAPKAPCYAKDASLHVMVPANARKAHVRLRDKLEEIARWAGDECVRVVRQGDKGSDAIVASGISVVLAAEAAPSATLVQVQMVHPFPAESIRAKVAGAPGVRVIEEGDPVLFEQCRLAGIEAKANPRIYRFGELSVSRVRRLLDGIDTPEPPPPPGQPPALCPGCPHRSAYQVLSDRKAIVTGDIGCYTLGVMPPFSAVDTCVCMGGGITVGLGLRKVLPPEEAKRVVSVIGDSTFVHSGLTGIAEMVYNPPPTGHVVVILDNSITAMTGMQENPATGRNLKHAPTYKMSLEDVVKAMGVPNVHVVDHVAHPEEFNALLDRAQAEGGLWTIIVRRPCLIAAPKIRQYDEANAAGAPIMPPPEAPCTEAPQGARATGDAAVKSVVIAGLGGQGVIKASDIFADAVFKSGYDVKKAEVHGMSQRGGSVNTDIRFGGSVGSPMVPNGEADILLVMDESQIPNTSHRLAPDGLLLSSKVLENFKYGAPKAATIAMLGVLSAHLDISEGAWHDAIRANLPEKLHEMNIAAFDAGRAWAKLPQGGADNR
ncbi:MAG: 2-oxoacid:acceptor oxidoreductase family protein [Kiritimatiellae bacterium]|nr:2-oxoacid:acceptor oxidoreductase family protein [Kiritimatiellia bacterium]